MIKTGFVALVGRPNVGKSTLMNHVIGQKIAITSEKPQTTRGRIQTVYDDERGQIIFLDTPGIHKAANKLSEYMDHVAEKTLEDVDVIVWLVEPTTYIGAGEQHIAEVMKKYDKPKILVINKIDTLKDPAVELTAAIEKYKDLMDFTEIVPVSAARARNIDELKKNQEQTGMILETANTPTESARMAMAVVAVGPILLIFPFFQKYFVQGLTVGSVKG